MEELILLNELDSYYLIKKEKEHLIAEKHALLGKDQNDQKVIEELERVNHQIYAVHDKLEL